MELTEHEQSILQGDFGEAVSKALAYQIQVGEYYGSERLIPIKQAHITADIEVMGNPGLSFLEIENAGAKFAVPTTTNARCVDFNQCTKMGQPEEGVNKERRVMTAVKDMGAMTIDSCINYQVAYQPRLGEHVAWGDTGTVIYANSVFGARTNFESGPSAMAAALTGRVPAYGFHLDENRAANVVVDIDTPIKDVADWGMIGRIIGSKVFDYRGVPVLTNVERFSPTSDDLKHLGASMATWSLGMYHAVGITPEARTLEDATKGRRVTDSFTITTQDLEDAYQSFEYEDSQVSLVVFSGPQLSLLEVEKIAGLLEGKKVHPGTTLILTVTASTLKQAELAGFVDIIQRAGGTFLTGVCFYILDGLSDIRKKNGWKTMVTNSVKLANNVKAHRFVPVVRRTDECIQVAIRGCL
ncbi:aconitase X catalytic domain-containing protein [Mammaliicoccus sciuri]|uniref:Predicted aconitase subunit 1 n=1 Tax=Sporosarcina newyorkensis TaxID=759851 RepID=A0A1T4Y0C0_9BACL|nr:aconitase X catalytic domain-containing protein [Sporosarcina newyorkensis]SKA94741.1 predicted aconitase subunit 1 [Sporosarcina newyorkensis]